MRCETCNIDIHPNSMTKHKAGFKHRLNEKNQLTEENSIIPENIAIQPQKDEETFDDIKNGKFVLPIIDIKPQKDVKGDVKGVKDVKLKKQSKKDEDDDNYSILSESEKRLYSDRPTKIQDGEYLLLIQKIKSYQSLFPDELKKLRIKKNSTVEDLNRYLEQIEVLISMKNIDNFIIETITESIRMVEPYSQRTKYNITGLSNILKGDPKFISLCKQLYLKYGTFVNIPPEIQIVLVIVSTSYLVIQKNNSMNQLNSYLNEPINTKK